VAEKGRLSVKENLPEIMAALAGSDLVFLTAGLGGGTGSGGLPVVAEALSQLEKPPLVVAVVTMPFSYEDFKLPLAGQVLEELYRHCNSVIAVDNSKLEADDPDLPFMENNKKADRILDRAVSSIIDLVDVPGEINIDFADVSAVLVHKGPAIISFGEGRGPRRAAEALKEAVSNPLVSEATLSGAQAVICNITCDDMVLVREVTEINRQIHQAIGSKVKLFFGLVVDQSLKDTSLLRVTVLASGLVREMKSGLSELDELSEEDLLPLETLDLDSEPGAGDQKAPVRMFLGEKEVSRPKLEVVAPAGRSENPPASMEPGPYAASRRTIRPQLEHYQGQNVSYNEESSGVEPVNNNPGLYDQPRFIRKPAD
jgi:cell division protein FtsZ